MPVISYCLVAYRVIYSKLLVEDLIRKTSVPYEILIWVNVQDDGFVKFLEEKIAQGAPIRIIGSSADNLGMQAFKQLFPAARGEMVVQLDDDVIALSRHAAQIVQNIFARYPDVGIVGGHVWQDRWTTGGRPPLKAYIPYAPSEGLYVGPIDGGFTVYRKGLTHLINGMRNAPYFALGVEMIGRASKIGYRAFLCTRILMFHVNGPIYSSHFGQLDAEIEKYHRVLRKDLAAEYEAAKASLPPPQEIATQIMRIHHAIELH